jgi:hypothetical protein
VLSFGQSGQITSESVRPSIVRGAGGMAAAQEDENNCSASNLIPSFETKGMLILPQPISFFSHTILTAPISPIWMIEFFNTFIANSTSL